MPENRESANSVTDLTRGIYRRIYSGFIKGQRINRLSLQAEAWFWRVITTVDDFGNGEADPELCHALTAGRRKVTPKQISAWLREMKDVGLIELYEVKGEPYLHVTGFEVSQPAGKNGKRIKRFPSPAESSGIQVNPELSSSAPASDSDNDTEDDTDNENVSPSATATLLFDYWREQTGHPNASFTDKRRKRVLARLNQGYTQGQIEMAIRGCMASSFHQGQNDTGEKYDDLELICRDGEHLEKFVAILENGGSKNGSKPTASGRRVETLRSNIELLSEDDWTVDREKPIGRITAAS